MTLFGCNIRIRSLEQTLQENFGTFVYTINYFFAHSLLYLLTVNSTYRRQDDLS